MTSKIKLKHGDPRLRAAFAQLHGLICVKLGIDSGHGSGKRVSAHLG